MKEGKERRKTSCGISIGRRKGGEGDAAATAAAGGGCELETREQLDLPGDPLFSERQDHVH